jgi:hypothetical protein
MRHVLVNSILELRRLCPLSDITGRATENTEMLCQHVQHR